MTFLRRRPGPIAQPDPRRHDSAEAYAYALMVAGVDTDEARELIRQNLRRWNHESLHAPPVDPERAADSMDGRQLSAAAASRKLLREAGYDVAEEWLDITPSPQVPEPDPVWGPWPG